MGTQTHRGKTRGGDGAGEPWAEASEGPAPRAPWSWTSGPSLRDVRLLSKLPQEAPGSAPCVVCGLPRWPSC